VLTKRRRDIDFSEKRAFFEAYALIVGEAAVKPLADELATANPQEVLRLLRTHESEALPGIIAQVARLKLSPAVAGLGSVLEHPEASLRLAAVEALGDIATPGAMTQVERALGDDDRAVRLAAVKLVGEKGYKGAQRRIEEVVLTKRRRDIDFSEKRAFFEAYALIVGEAAVKPLAEILRPRGFLQRKRSPELRMCAALALGRVGTPEAEAVLGTVVEDRDRQVRNAAAAALKAFKS